MAADETHLLNLAESEFPEMISINIICRLCANQSDKLIGIYSEDGINNDLAGKLNLYLPIKVSESDNLPLQCCWQCASTVLAWHDLVITSVEADRRLRSYQLVSEKQLEEISSSYGEAEHMLATSAEETLVATESISKHTTIHYETINAAELLIDDTKSKIGNSASSYPQPASIIATSSPENVLYQNVTPEENNGEFTDVLVKKESCISLKAESEQSDVEGEETQEGKQSIYKSECRHCPSVFLDKSDAVRHVKEDHSDQYLCPSDEETEMRVNNDAPGKERKKTNSKRSFHVRHMTKHPLQKINQEEVNKAKVVVDGRVFYKCKQCGKSLHSIYTYVWHIRIHTGERPYVCNLCNKQFRVSQGLVRHLRETHERIKNFDCDICGRCFATKRNAEEHRRIHTNERPYVCATCGKAFKQKASLFVHNRSHSTNFPFSCPECPQKFRTKHSLLVHVTKHTGEKPFPCDVCGRHFRIKYELKRHKVIHSEEKPFTCRICMQLFRQKRYLRNHLKLNHNISNPTEWLEEYSNAI